MEGRELKAKAAITGLGISEMGRVYGHDASHFAAEAIQRAVADAGLRKQDIDGLLVNPGVSPIGGMGGVGLQNYLGLTNLRLLSSMNVGGATASVMVQYAAMSVIHGLANHVVCVFADAPLREGRGGGAAYAASGRGTRPSGMGGLYAAFGVFGVNAHYALAARRHMAMYGTTNDQLGAIAVAERQWAAMNPIAEHRDPITIEDYHASRWVAEPLHLLDCCLVSNGGVAVIVSRADEAKSLSQPPAYVWGMGQGHPGDMRRKGWDVETQTGAPMSKEKAFAMAGIGVADVDVVPGVRLLHVHGARHARGLRLLRQGRGRPVRRGRQARAGRQSADEHRRRPAQRVLHVGHDAALGGRDPGARAGRRAPGREARRGARDRQRRHPRPPQHARAVAARGVMRWSVRHEWEEGRHAPAVPPSPRIRRGAVDLPDGLTD